MPQFPNLFFFEPLLLRSKNQQKKQKTTTTKKTKARQQNICLFGISFLSNPLVLLISNCAVAVKSGTFGCPNLFREAICFLYDRQLRKQPFIFLETPFKIAAGISNHFLSHDNCLQGCGNHRRDSRYFQHEQCPQKKKKKKQKIKP